MNEIISIEIILQAVKYSSPRAVEILNDSHELTVFLEKLELRKEMNMDEPIGKPVYPRDL